MPASREATNCHLHLGILLVLLLLANRLPAMAEPAATVDSAGQEIIALPTPTGSMLQTRVLRPADREPFPVRRHERCQLGEAPTEPSCSTLVGVDRGVGQLGLELGVLTDQFVDLLEHGTSLGGRTMPAI